MSKKTVSPLELHSLRMLLNSTIQMCYRQEKQIKELKEQMGDYPFSHWLNDVYDWIKRYTNTEGFAGIFMKITKQENILQEFFKTLYYSERPFEEIKEKSIGWLKQLGGKKEILHETSEMKGSKKANLGKKVIEGKNSSLKPSKKMQEEMNLSGDPFGFPPEFRSYFGVKPVKWLCDECFLGDDESNTKVGWCNEGGLPFKSLDHPIEKCDGFRPKKKSLDEDKCKDCFASQHDEEFGDICAAPVCIKEYDYDPNTRSWHPKAKEKKPSNVGKWKAIKTFRISEDFKNLIKKIDLRDWKPEKKIPSDIDYEQCDKCGWNLPISCSQQKRRPKKGDICPTFKPNDATPVNTIICKIGVCTYGEPVEYCERYSCKCYNYEKLHKKEETSSEQGLMPHRLTEIEKKLYGKVKEQPEYGLSEKGLEAIERIHMEWLEKKGLIGVSQEELREIIQKYRRRLSKHHSKDSLELMVINILKEIEKYLRGT